jgi:hypothetical protein
MGGGPWYCSVRSPIPSAREAQRADGDWGQTGARRRRSGRGLISTRPCERASGYLPVRCASREGGWFFVNARHPPPICACFLWHDQFCHRTPPKFVVCHMLIATTWPPKAGACPAYAIGDVIPVRHDLLVSLDNGVALWAAQHGMGLNCTIVSLMAAGPDGEEGPIPPVI